MMNNKCKNCKHWDVFRDEEGIEDTHHYSGLLYDRDADLEQILPAVRKVCNSPKTVFYERPDLDGAAVVDGSEYSASLITGPDYGCVNFEWTE